MPSDDIETMLRADFEDLSAGFENDRFTEKLLYRLGVRRRARMGVIGLAGAFGAGLAASQFANVVGAIAPSLAASAPAGPAFDLSTQLAATLILAGALAATAMVLRQDG